MSRTLTAHPVATLFPDMPEADFSALVEDIRRNGLKVPILVHRGAILDGRHRYKACQQLGIPCASTQWNGRDPWFEVQSRNLVRRHLAKDQVYAIRKLAAERFPELSEPMQAVREEAKRRQARKPRDTEAAKAVLRSHDRNKESADLIGAQLGVSGSTVKRVDRLAREAPEMVSKVAAGELSVIKALREVALQKHGHPTIRRVDAQGYAVEPVVRRLRQLIKTDWTRCPMTQRRAFLYALQQLFRELIAEHTESSAPRLATGTEHASKG